MGARVVPEALRARGVSVKTYAELYPTDDAVPDAVWTPEVTRRGWVILTKDKSIRKNPAEIAAVRASQARYVCLAAGGLTGDQQAECLSHHWRTIEGVLHARRAPVLITVTRAAVLWLDGTDWREAKRKRERGGGR